MEKVDANYKAEEVRIYITCDLNVFDYGGETCALYDHAPLREWCHLDTLQYKRPTWYDRFYDFVLHQGK